MNRADVHVAKVCAFGALVLQNPPDSSLELVRRLFGKREGHDGAWVLPLLDKIGNPPGNNLRLARSGTRYDEQVTLIVVDCLLLFRCE